MGTIPLPVLTVLVQVEGLPHPAAAALLPEERKDDSKILYIGPIKTNHKNLLYFIEIEQVFILPEHTRCNVFAKNSTNKEITHWE